MCQYNSLRRLSHTLITKLSFLSASAVRLGFGGRTIATLERMKATIHMNWIFIDTYIHCAGMKIIYCKLSKNSDLFPSVA